MTPTPLLPETVAAILERYAVGELCAPPAPGGGTANANITLETTAGKFFMKRRNPKYARREYVAFDYRLMEYLAPFRLGTPLSVPTRQGERWLEWEGDVYELFPFQLGAAHDPASRAQLAAAGRRLAEFHRATQAFFAPPGKEWPRYHDPARIRDGLREMEGDLRSRLSPTDFAYLWRQAERLASDFSDARYYALPRLVIHGDYHPGNLIFEGGAVVGVFDLDWATEQPRILDLADGVFLFAGIRPTPTDATDIVSLTQTWVPSPERTRDFWEGYESIEIVTPEEEKILSAAIRARWLYCRVAGRLKLPEERRLDYFLEGLLEPLRAMEDFTWR